MKPAAITEPGADSGSSCLKVAACLNHFEVTAPWGMSRAVLAEQAQVEFNRWLRRHMDLTDPSVYDSREIGKGGDHG